MEAFPGTPKTAVGIGFNGIVGSGDALGEDVPPGFDGPLTAEDAFEVIPVGLEVADN